MIILGIESSCDDTGIGIVDENRNILANVTYTQFQEHLATRGVVPEIAARAHAQKMAPLITQALQDADLTWDDVDGIAATTGPGLIGGVMVGMMTAKGIAAALNKPFIAINHLEAHVLTPRLTHDVPFPYLTLLVSGGHTQILVARGLGDYTLLGASLDDAVGETFDKGAKMMGLPYPGGPTIEKLAGLCENPAAAAARYPLPTSMVGRPGCDFSFSGLKTALHKIVQDLPAGAIPTDTLADLSASLQSTIGEILIDRLQHALTLCETPAQAGVHGCQLALALPLRHLLLSGGVAANQYLRAQIAALATTHHMDLVAPPLKLCTDNGVMVAWAGLEYLERGKSHPLTTPARPRWPLETLKEQITS